MDGNGGGILGGKRGPVWREMGWHQPPLCPRTPSTVSLHTPTPIAVHAHPSPSIQPLSLSTSCTPFSIHNPPPIHLHMPPPHPPSISLLEKVFQSFSA